jgi:hypothetical protein
MTKISEDYPGKELSIDELKNKLVAETKITKIAQSKFPTEIIDLPSEGKLYPAGHPLTSGKIEMKYMTAKEEDILTSQNLIQKGIVIDMLLRSLIVSNGEGVIVNYDDLVIGDKNAIMIAARILGYGAEYPIEVSCPKCQGKVKEVVDLASLDNKEVDLGENGNNFEFTLPLSKKLISFKILTHSDEKLIEGEIKRMKKRTKSSMISYDLTSRLKTIITAIDGEDTKQAVDNFVENEFVSRDSLAFRKHLESISPDVDMTIFFECDSCQHEGDVTIPMTVDFFWPRV